MTTDPSPSVARLSEPSAASVAYPVGVSVRPVTLSKTFRDARQRDAAAIKALRAKASDTQTSTQPKADGS